jgi:Pyruvate/2-oxoacid:ferredoxin oxidoreductase gamma subunit
MHTDSTIERGESDGMQKSVYLVNESVSPTRLECIKKKKKKKKKEKKEKVTLWF